MKKSTFLLLITLFITNVLAARAYVQVGKATYYGPRFHLKRTASGERFHMDSFTAAHRTLPFGTVVKVTNIKSRASVIVRINDRGPFGKSKIIDLSVAAAKKVGVFKSGVAKVRVEVIKAVRNTSRHRKQEEKAKPKPIQPEPLAEAKVPLKKVEICAYAVQTGAYKDAGNAMHAQEVLASKGYVNSSMDVVDLPNGKLYRVYLGPFKQPDEAETIRKGLAEQNPDVFVITLREIKE